MHHTYELIETQEHDAASPWKVSRLLGEINGAKRYLAIARADADYLSSLLGRIGQEGDDPVDVFSDNTLLALRVNGAQETVLRAEGILTCAQRRYDAWNEQDEQTRIENAEKSAWGTGGP